MYRYISVKNKILTAENDILNGEYISVGCNKKYVKFTFFLQKSQASPV